jgi:hypothetical protein
MEDLPSIGNLNFLPNLVRSRYHPVLSREYSAVRGPALASPLLLATRPFFGRWAHEVERPISEVSTSRIRLAQGFEKDDLFRVRSPLSRNE